MKKFRLIFLLPLAMATEACPAVLNLPPSPASLADRTIADEQALRGIEFGYKAARIAVEIMVDSGQCRGACATRFRDLNRRAYAAVQAAETAYRTANADGWFAALGEARQLSNDLLSLTGRNQ